MGKTNHSKNRQLKWTFRDSKKGDHFVKKRDDPSWMSRGCFFNIWLIFDLGYFNLFSNRKYVEKKRCVCFFELVVTNLLNLHLCFDCR